MSDVYSPGIATGSTDWSGARAPSGGSHTGTSTITMADGSTFVVAHGAAEVLRKLDAHAVAPADGAPAWVGFDRPNVAVGIVLNVRNVVTVSPLP